MSQYKKSPRKPVSAPKQQSASSSTSFSAFQSAVPRRPDRGAVSAQRGRIPASDRAVSVLCGSISTSDAAASSAYSQCILCCNSIEWRCLMDCGHVICHACGIRLRVLCSKLECPVCRQETTKAVVLASDDDSGGGSNIDGASIAQFRNLFERAIYMDDRHKLAYDDEGSRRACSRLLEHRCSLCAQEAQRAFDGRDSGAQKQTKFDVFSQLQTHMRREHDLHYCQLCVDNLAVFSSERRVYTREQLGRHRRKGDPDDSSHKGHPLCQFCDVRYLDKDSLFLHLRRDHFICHLCDSNNTNMAFYSDYPQLEDHFRNSHFLCDQAACLEKRFIVFDSKIDLLAHRSSVHSEGKSRGAQRQERTVTLELFSNGANIVSGGSRSNSDRRRQGAANPASASSNSAFSSDARTQLSGDLENISVQEPPQQRIPEPADFPSLSSLSIATTSSQATPVSVSSRAAIPRPPSTATAGSSGNNTRPSGNTAGSSGNTARSSGSNTRPSGNTARSSGSNDMTLWCNGRYNRLPNFDAEFPSLLGGAAATVAQSPHAARGAITGRSRGTAGGRGQRHAQGGGAKSHVTVTSKNRGRVIPASTSGLDEAFPALSLPPGRPPDRDVSARCPGNNWSIKNNNNQSVKPRSAPSTRTAAAPASFQQVDFPSLTASTSTNTKSTPSTPPVPPFPPVPPSPVESDTATVGRYRKPARFDERSKKLVKSVRQMVGDSDKFDRFKLCSAEYRRGNITASSYYWQCLQLMRQDGLGKVFSELLVLLPDIARQTDLLEVHQNSSTGSGHRTRFMVCPVCNQILVFDDYSQHTFVHYENGEEVLS